MNNEGEVDINKMTELELDTSGNEGIRINTKEFSLMKI